MTTSQSQEKMYIAASFICIQYNQNKNCDTFLNNRSSRCGFVPNANAAWGATVTKTPQFLDWKELHRIAFIGLSHKGSPL